MIEQIGEMAGHIYRYLEKNGETNVTSLAKELKEKEFVVFAALGWLARENKVDLYLKGKIKIAKIK